MFSMILSAAVLGVEARPVQVEADVCDGLPMFCMVGDLSPEVREAADRVRTALKNTGIQIPPKRITVNLSPADIRKQGTRYDLPVAAALLAAFGILPEEFVSIADEFHEACWRRGGCYFRTGGCSPILNKEELELFTPPEQNGAKR